MKKLSVKSFCRLFLLATFLIPSACKDTPATDEDDPVSMDNTSPGDDDSLKKQVAMFQSKLTSATADEYLQLEAEWKPSDEDLETIYGEYAKYAITKRDTLIAKQQLDPERLQTLIQKNQRHGPVNEDEFSIEVSPHDDFKVTRAQKEGLLNGDFPIRKYSVATRDSLSGFGSVIHVNGRWVQFIALDNLYIQLGR